MHLVVLDIYGGSLAQRLAHLLLDLAVLGLNHGSRVFSKEILINAEFIYRAVQRVRVDGTKSLRVC